MGVIASQQMLLQVGAVVVAVIASRFLWIITVTYGVRFFAPGLRDRDRGNRDRHQDRLSLVPSQCRDTSGRLARG